MRLVLAILVSAFVTSSLPICAQAPAANRPPTVSETESAAMHLRVAMKAVEDGDFQIALEEVSEAAKLAPADAAIQFALATILDKTGKTEEALAALDKAQAIGVPDTYKAKVDDLRATLLYKRRKAAFPVVEPTVAGRTIAPPPLGPRPPGGTFVLQVPTDSDGRYSLAYPIRGQYIVQFSRPGFATYRLEVSGSFPPVLDVVLPESASGEVSSLPRPRGSSKAIRGQVRDVAGVVLRDVLVELYRVP